MPTVSSRQLRSTGVRLLHLLVAAGMLAACSEDGEATADPEVTVPVSNESAESADSTVSQAFEREVAEMCDLTRYAGLPTLDGTPEGVAEALAILGEAGAGSPLEMLEVPQELEAGFALVVEASSSATAELRAAEQAASAGDVASAERSVVRHIAHLWSIAGRFALMGAQCGAAEPARAAGADLNVPLDLHAEQLSVGFGSVWVSQKYGDNVVRVDPETGEILATIEVGTDPLKLQPADGRMWVRTADAYVAIDAASNRVVDALSKADVGPATNRNFAIDGAMWICDGRRLHRYDLTTLEPATMIELGFDCDFVYATDDLVVAWNHNEDPGESGQSATAMIDPINNAVLATISLPVDVVWPVVVGDTVFFGGAMNARAVVIDRDSWAVTSTIELPDLVGGGGITTDGESIFLPTRGQEPWDVLVLDAETFELVDTLEPLNVNSVVVDDGALWVTHPRTNILQRFDLPR